MDFFGIGPMELMLILILALVVFGPGKLPEIGAKLGSSLREMRKATREFSREIDETRQAIEGPINDMKAPMQELAEPFQEAGTAVAGARDVLANPSKAIEGYVMGQYASADKPAKAAADEPPPTHPAESADVLTGAAVASDSAAAETESDALGGVAAEAVAAEATVAEAAIAETDGGAAEPVSTEAPVVETEPAAAEPVASAAATSVEAEPVEPIRSDMTSGEIAVSPDPGVVSAIAAMESAFANATPVSSGNAESAGETEMAHKMPGVAEGSVGAAAFDVTAPESPMTASPEPTVTAAASDAPSAVSDAPTATPDVAAAVPEPVRMPAQSPAAQPAGQTDAELPPPQPVTARARHRSAPRKSASPSLQISPGEGGAPSSHKPASQD